MHFSARRIEFLTVCIEDERQYHLAHVMRLGPDRENSGAPWRTGPDGWKSFDSRPESAEIDSFDDALANRLDALQSQGWLPRPDGLSTFHADKLVIRVSEAIPDFDPNAGLDTSRAAELMREDVFDAGRPRLGEFTFAPYHKPRWCSATAGLSALRGYIDMLEPCSGNSSARSPLMMMIWKS